MSQSDFIFVVASGANDLFVDVRHSSPDSSNSSDVSTLRRRKTEPHSSQPIITFQQMHASSGVTAPQITKLSDTEKRPMVQTFDLSSGSDDDEAGNCSACECLRALTDQLCVVNAMERRHVWIPVDTIFSKTSTILDSAASALECQQCGIDSKVLLLVMTLLQTVFNWAMLEQQHCGDNSNTPVVVFGKWKMSGEESDIVKAILVNRVLARSSSITDKLRQRVIHVSRMANNNTVPYQVMDAATLEFVLQRLVFSVREVVHRVKSKTIQP